MCQRVQDVLDMLVRYLLLQVKHLINYTVPSGIARQRITAGEGRREMEADLACLYTTVFKYAAKQQPLAHSSPALTTFQDVVKMLKDAKWLRVPASTGRMEDLLFVSAAQVCFDLDSPIGSFFPEPVGLCDEVPAEARRAFLLALGAVSAQEEAAMPPPLPKDAASRQVRS